MLLLNALDDAIFDPPLLMAMDEDKVESALEGDCLVDDDDLLSLEEEEDGVGALAPS